MEIFFHFENISIFLCTRFWTNKYYIGTLRERFPTAEYSIRDSGLHWIVGTVLYTLSTLKISSPIHFTNNLYTYSYLNLGFCWKLPYKFAPLAIQPRKKFILYWFSQLSKKFPKSFLRMGDVFRPKFALYINSCLSLDRIGFNDQQIYIHCYALGSMISKSTFIAVA